MRDEIFPTYDGSPNPRTAPYSRLDELHPEILGASGELYEDRHYSSAIEDAYKAIEVRLREMTGSDAYGQRLLKAAFDGDPPAIWLGVEPDLSGRNEHAGFKCIFEGAMKGIRNPKAHGLIRQDDSVRAMEYLALASLLMRRLDDSSGSGEVRSGGGVDR